MLLKKCEGYELEKEKSNTSEDFFNRSEVVYVENGKEKTLHVLYVRYFDEVISEFTPYSENPIFKSGSKEIYFKDIVALVCLIKNSKLRDRKRLYINSKVEFASYFQDVDFTKLPEIFNQLEQGFELKSSIEYIVQPK